MRYTRHNVYIKIILNAINVNKWRNINKNKVYIAVD